MVKSLKGEVVTLETDESYYIMVDLLLDPRCLMNIMDFYHIRFAGKKTPLNHQFRNRWIGVPLGHSIGHLDSRTEKYPHSYSLIASNFTISKYSNQPTIFHQLYPHIVTLLMVEHPEYMTYQLCPFIILYYPILLLVESILSLCYPKLSCIMSILSYIVPILTHVIPY